VDFIQSYRGLHGYAPTYTEIGQAVGLASVSTVHMHIHNLRRKGVLSATDQRRARASQPEVTPEYRILQDWLQWACGQLAFEHHLGQAAYDRLQQLKVATDRILSVRAAV
jgi:SOS-response transcriptional repressor LexA